MNDDDAGGETLMEPRVDEATIIQPRTKIIIITSDAGEKFISSRAKIIQIFLAH